MTSIVNTTTVVQIIITVGAIITTWLTLKYRGKIANKLSKQPDRIQFIYNGYESLIRELQKDLDKARRSNERQHDTIDGLQEKVNLLNENVRICTNENKELHRKLKKYEAS